MNILKPRHNSNILHFFSPSRNKRSRLIFVHERNQNEYFCTLHNFKKDRHIHPCFGDKLVEVYAAPAGFKAAAATGKTLTSAPGCHNLELDLVSRFQILVKIANIFLNNGPIQQINGWGVFFQSVFLQSIPSL